MSDLKFAQRDFDAELQALEAASLKRQMHVLRSPQGVDVLLEGRLIVNVSSNDYLGLANAPELIEALQLAAKTQGVGSGASHWVSGHTQAHAKLEQSVSDWLQREESLVFSSGYAANLAIFQAFVQAGDCVFQDRLNHASLLDGAQLVGARSQRFAHLDTCELEHKIKASGKLNSTRHCFIVTDGVFSMEGDVASLDVLANIAEKYQACLVVDDAHGLGVLGETGAGSVSQFDLSAKEVPILMGTFGKALGGQGAFVAGDRNLMQWMRQTARAYVYSTALSPAMADTMTYAIHLVKNQVWRRDKLHDNIAYFHECMAHFPWPLLPSQTAIQPVIAPSVAQLLKTQSKMFDKGFWVAAIRSPTVPKGTQRLRISLSASHSKSQILQLVTALRECV